MTTTISHGCRVTPGRFADSQKSYRAYCTCGWFDVYLATSRERAERRHLDHMLGIFPGLTAVTR